MVSRGFGSLKSAPLVIQGSHITKPKSLLLNMPIGDQLHPHCLGHLRKARKLSALGDVTQFYLCLVVKTLLLASRVWGRKGADGQEKRERITEPIAPGSTPGASISIGCSPGCPCIWPPSVL